jgi:hypothetical protein
VLRPRDISVLHEAHPVHEARGGVERDAPNPAGFQRVGGERAHPHVDGLAGLDLLRRRVLGATA